MASRGIINQSDYKKWILSLKNTIKQRQIKATVAINNELILLYWDLGKQIVDKQRNAKWGSGFINQLSKDLKKEFPKISGFSVTNLNYCRRFFLFYSTGLELKIIENLFLPQAGAEIQSSHFQTDIILPQAGGEIETLKITMLPWGHHKLIIDKCASVEQALFYVKKTVENNWSRSVLEYQIETNLYNRQGKAISNFETTLPTPQSDLANELFKDPYHFNFLELSEKVKEIDLEKALVAHISQFLLELGKGFAYMGRQYRFKIGNKEYRSDLVFYHTKLKCYIIIELKVTEFEPEFIGKLNYYISAFNKLIKDDNDQQTIGILLCKNKDSYEVEFALKDVNKPISVSSYQYTELMDDIKEALPSKEELQNELRNFDIND